ncbi:MAG TPA: bifunctional hydroxymethylpyrimidine kinase/phosphomethylpyrimidine kinase, partial [Polyangia bacterium]
MVVGGLDPGGGAGLLRDVATALSLGAQPHAVGTAWTEQGPGIHRVEPRAPATAGAALAHALATFRPAAVKIGMAASPATAAALVEALANFAGPVVVDPVLATSRGGPLWAGAPVTLLPLLRRATLVTPNAVEAAALADRPVATVAEAEAAGRHLVEVEGLEAVLVKGGHLAESDGSLTDLLVTSSGTTRYPHQRAPGPSPRGTGCALATAIAVELGRGRPLGEAVHAAMDWLVASIAAATNVGDERHLPV